MAIQQHLDWLREGSAIWNSRRQDVGFRADLSDAPLREYVPKPENDDQKDFDGYDFGECNLTGSNVANLKLRGARFTRSVLQGLQAVSADFSGSKFFSAQLQGADLTSTDFSNTRLRGANFKGAVYPNAIFDEAKTVGAIGLVGVLSDERSSDFEANGGLREIEDFVAHRRDDFLILESATPSFKPRKQQQNTYKVFYATNREKVLSADGYRIVDFSDVSAVSLSYGTATIIIPEAHKIGQIGKSWWKKLFSAADSLSVRELVDLNRELYLAHVRKSFASKGARTNPTFFIHGFNTSFQDALLRAGQIGFDIGINSGIGMFSWPSQGRKVDYVADTRAMEASKYLLAEFIEELAASMGGKKINFIAHSMGCRCFVTALEHLQLKGSSALSSIGNVILAAADVDQGIMPRMGTAVTQNALLSTSYVSKADVALGLSAKLSKGDRVGKCPPVFTMADLEVVRVVKASLLGLGHGYVAENKDVIKDMFYILSENLPASKRHGLKSLGVGINSFWHLSE